MNTITHQSYSKLYPARSTSHRSVWTHFMSWCEGQEKNRFGWLAAGLAGHGCFITPLTLLAVMLSGNSMVFWAFTIAAMTMTLVTNLAALSTKITIPVLFLSVLIDAGIIIASIAGIVIQ
ncbi:MAG TPA: hypothetical protein VIZ28_02370 [Chitinophagaceae bacterium]